MKKKLLKIECIATGNELLDGSICDGHSHHVAGRLRELGLSLSRSTQLPDDEEVLSKAFQEAAARSDIVIVTGGLGPTSDDLSLEVASRSFGAKLVKDAVAEKSVQKRIRVLGRKLNAGHRKQMWIPQGSKAVLNPEGTAPFVWWKLPQSQFFFLPGVPAEFDFGFENVVLKAIQKLVSGTSKKHLFVFKVFGRAESELNEKMKTLKCPKLVEIGFRTSLPENHIKLWVEAPTQALAEKRISPLRSKLKKELGLSLFSLDGSRLEEVFLKELVSKRKRLVLAESCTGGLLSSLITSVPGSSKILDRSFITYSNEAKQELLGVKSSSLSRYGAVSEQVSAEMAQGALKASKANLALSITGIAGPGRGHSKKPVGLVWMSLCSSRGVQSKRFLFPFDRSLNQKFSAYAAIQMAREFLHQPR